MSGQTEIEYWANFVVGLLDKGEWKVLLSSLAITFALTYILKVFYFGLPIKTNRYHIRFAAILSGFVAAALIWESSAISMQWYSAGIMLGPLSILLHHILKGYSKTVLAKSTTPWLYPLISGKERRKKKR